MGEMNFTLAEEDATLTDDFEIIEEGLGKLFYQIIVDKNAKKYLKLNNLFCPCSTPRNYYFIEVTENAMIPLTPLLQINGKKRTQGIYGCFEQLTKQYTKLTSDECKEKLNKTSIVEFNKHNKLNFDELTEETPCGIYRER